MRDVDAGDAADLVQALDFGAHFHAQLGVQVGQRLVEEEQLRVARQCAAHGDALALPTRQLRRAAVQQVLYLQHGGDFLDALVALFLGHLAHFEGKTDVVGDAHGGVERIALEHHGNVALRRRYADDVFAADVQFAFGGVFQAGNDVEQGRFAATRGADQDQKFARRDVYVDALEHFDGLVSLAEDFADAFDVKRCCHGVLYPFTAPAVSPLTKY